MPIHRRRSIDGYGPASSGPEHTRRYLKKTGTGQVMLDEAHLLPEEETFALIDAFQNNDDRAAFDAVVFHNMRLVRDAAKRFARKYPYLHLDIEDLTSEGTFGLMDCIETFDTKRNIRFSTYANRPIENAIRRSIYDQGRTIRIPVHIFESHVKLNKGLRTLVEQGTKDPILPEISAASGLSMRKLPLVRHGACMMRTDHFSGFLAHDNHEPAAPNLPPPAELSAAEELAALERIDDELMAPDISEQDRRIFRMRYGLDHPEGVWATLKQVAEVEGLTRERVRQISEEVLAKLRIAFDFEPDR